MDSRITWTTSLPSNAGATRSPNKSTTNRALARLSCNWWAVSRSVYSGLMLVSISPAFSTP